MPGQETLQHREGFREDTEQKEEGREEGTGGCSLWQSRVSVSLCYRL